MRTTLLTAIAALGLATTALAESHGGGGDVEAGEKAFKKCLSCHAVVAEDGTVVVKGGKTGPNLYGVLGRPAAAEDGYRYKAGILEAAEKGLVWDEANFVAYLQDPSGFLKEFTGDSGARSGMSFRLRKGMEDVYAYLLSIGPEM
ncbi:c-type cytochrome [Salipiger sp.]|uniref:c-type cytochrome n=1 Tax=Salipiger sp. TaxID=2078585 RepID=UPI003A96C53F